MNVLKSFVKNCNDLSFLKDIVPNYQIIGLGEATHGNSEFHLLRAEFSKYLIKECNFNGVIMEFPFSKSVDLNNFVKNGKGNLKQLMLNLGYWTVATEEIKDFILWLRKFNSLNPKSIVNIYGNDVDINDKIRLKPGKFRDKKMTDKTLKISKGDKFVVWAHNHHVSRFKGGDFTSMGYYLSKEINYFPIASLFYQGSLTAMEYNSKKKEWGNIKSFKLKTAEKESIESRLAKLSNKDFFINLQELSKENNKEFTNVKARFLGAGFDAHEKSSMFQKMDLVKMFDGIIFTKKVTPSKLIR